MMQDLLRVLYNAGLLSPSIKVTVPSVAADLFLSLPSLTFQSIHDNRIALDLYAWGPLTVTPPGGSPEFHKVKFRARVLIPLAVAIVGGKLVFSMVASGATVTNVQIDPYSNGLFSPPALAYILSPEFQALVSLGVPLALTQMGTVFPPLQLSFLGAIALDPTASVVSRVLDGTLALGIDVDTPGGRTQGNPLHLGDTTNGNDIGIWTNPDVILQAFPDVKQKIDEKVLAVGATLDSFDMWVEEGWFRIAGRASKTGGAVNFSLRSVPKLIRPGVHIEFDEEYGEHVDMSTPDREELWFDPQGISVDVDRDWWVVLIEGVGALFAGIGALVVEAFLDVVRGNVTSGIQQNVGARAARNQEFTIPGVSRPSMRLRIETYECHVEGVYAGITIKSQFWGASIDGPRQVSVEEALNVPLTFRVGLPPDALSSDPELRASWTLRRTDTNEILYSSDTQARVGRTFTFDGALVPYLELNRLSVEWRVYRTLGAGTDEVYTGQRYIDITDYVDRSHPYVRWTHEVDVPIVRVESNGSQTVLGREIILRHSNIHRTAIPGRCRMLVRGSRLRLINIELSAYPYTYLDQLPFPPEDILANRAQLCDYCFFGGPDKDIPLI